MQLWKDTMHSEQAVRVATQYASAPCKLTVSIRQVAVLFRHNNIFVVIRQVAHVPARWLFKTSATS